MTPEELREVVFRASVGVLERLGTGAYIDQSVVDALSSSARMTLTAGGFIRTDAPLLAAVPNPPPERRVLRSTSRKLVDIDRELRARLQTAANAAMKRTLEKAGAKLVSKARAASGAALRPYLSQKPPPHHVAMLVPTAILASLGLDESQLLDTAFDDLRDQFERWVAEAQRSAARTAAQIVGVSADDAVTKLRAAQDVAREQAWNYLHGQLRSQAVSLLGADEVVATDTLVPPDLLRVAMAFAGGISATSAGIGRDSRPADAGEVIGQIGTGGIITTYLEASGAQIEEYEWVHGASDQPFPPHEDLDGVVFGNFDDAVLAVQGSFPDTGFYHPGDHDSCSCDFVQHWAVAAEDTASAA